MPVAGPCDRGCGRTTSSVCLRCSSRLLCQDSTCSTVCGEGQKDFCDEGRDLNRVGRFCQGIYLKFVENLTFEDISADIYDDRIEIKHEELPLDEAPILRVPAQLVPPGPEKQAVLLHKGCMYVLALTHDFLVALLFGTGLADPALSTDVLYMAVKKQPRPVVEAKSSPTRNCYNHDVCEVHMIKSKRRWTLDLTAPQFGFDQIVLPAQTYEHNIGFDGSDVYCDMFRNTLRRVQKGAKSDDDWSGIRLNCAKELRDIINTIQFEELRESLQKDGDSWDVASIACLQNVEDRIKTFVSDAVAQGSLILEVTE